MMQISATELKARLVSFAKEIGFDSCRVAACNAPAHANDFREWLRDGAHGEMNYMQRGEEKRCDPEKILPAARSIVALALNYFQGDAAHRAAATGRTGRIARTRWGEDYHDVIGAKLNRIDEFLRSFGGQQKCYVDTGPCWNGIMPRKLALAGTAKAPCLSMSGSGPGFFSRKF
jgi:Uncharacterized Fe-S protein